AAFDALTGLPTAWNPNASGAVRALALWTLGPTIYSVLAGGEFTAMGGSPCRRLASLDPVTASPQWVANADGTVYSLALADTLLQVTGQLPPVPVPSFDPTLFVGGSFSNINSLPRSRLAQIQVRSGAPTSWAPNVQGGDVLALALADFPQSGSDTHGYE